MRLDFFVVGFLSCLVPLVVAQTNATDQAALVAFWNGLTNKGNLGSSWNTSASLCGKFFVSCDGNGKVTTLNPFSYSLAGTIASQLGLLTSLTNL